MSGYSVAGVASARLAGSRRVPAGLAPAGAELVAFAALCAFAGAHWIGLVREGPGLRLLAVVAIATACGAALAATAPLPRRVAYPLRPLIALAALAAALVAMGLPARLLAPSRWDDLATGLDRGLTGLQAADYPIAPDADAWVPLTLLLAAPAASVAAAAAAFWPAGRARPALRVLGLGLLLAVYGAALAQRPLDLPLLRGLALLVLVAAWLWLPRLAVRDLAGAAVAVAVTGLVALPVAAKLDAESPWLDYRHWRWHALPAGESFHWDHSYGPLSWPRRGRTVLYVKSPKPYYWKAETLDSFDGFRWYRSALNAGSSAGAEIPSGAIGRRARSDWFQRIEVSVERLRSRVAIGAGTTFLVRGTDVGSYSADGTTTVDDPLESGRRYTAEVYVPEPGVPELQRANDRYDSALLQYTTIAVPRPGEVYDDRTSPGDAARPLVSVGLRGAPGSGTPAAAERLLHSPYAATYRLARRLAQGRGSAYDVVASTERYLRRQYAYSERVPRHDYPLPAFLFQDGIGYCQQFSGAMALLLRMDGIPARVATGFAPGSYDARAKAWRVRDDDAHSWVEVWFQGIGWVTFDPTPPAAPARRLADVSGSAAGATRPAIPRGQRQVPPASERAGGGGVTTAGGGEALPWWAIALAVAATGCTALLALAWARPAAARRRARPVDADLRELEEALRRLGFVLDPGTTLAQLERRLERTVGPDAAAYVRRLRELRYSPRPSAGPTRSDRRALRRALARSGGPLQRLRALAALPPGLGRREGGLIRFSAG